MSDLYLKTLGYRPQNLLKGTEDDVVRWFTLRRVDNLLDQDIEEAFGFSATDIAAYFGVQVTL